MAVPLLCAAIVGQGPPSSPPPSLHREFAVGSLLLTLGVLAAVGVAAYVIWFTSKAPAKPAPTDAPPVIPAIELRPFSVQVRRAL